MKLKGKPHNKSECLQQIVEYVEEYQPVSQKELASKMEIGYGINNETAHKWVNTLKTAGKIIGTNQGLETPDQSSNG